MPDRRRSSVRVRSVAALALCVLPALAAALELNSANRAQLEQVNGIGVAMAERILVERERGGAFSGWTDFARRVPGFRARALDRLAQQGVTINGEARAPAAAAPAAPGGASVGASGSPSGGGASGGASGGEPRGPGRPPGP